MIGSARERILVAADELFYGDGIATTGVDAVVARAGVSIGSIYNNFGGKDGLVQAYLRRCDHLWRATWARVAAEAATPRDRVLAVFDALREWNRDWASDQRRAHIAGLVQLPAGHPAVTVARVHKEPWCAGWPNSPWGSPGRARSWSTSRSSMRESSSGCCSALSRRRRFRMPGNWPELRLSH